MHDFLRQMEEQRRQRTYVWPWWLTPVILILVALALLLIISKPTHAEPPKGMSLDPSVSAWFLSLKQPGTEYSCCGLGDCRTVPDDHWRTNGKNYQVLFGDKWVDIPQGIVLHRDDNPTGKAVLCARAYETGIVLYCFTVPPMA